MTLILTFINTSHIILNTVQERFRLTGLTQ